MWRVEYITSGPVSTMHTFYGDGTYNLLTNKDRSRVAVYLIRNRVSRFLGFMGAVDLPPDFPAIEFPPGSDQAMVTNA